MRAGERTKVGMRTTYKMLIAVFLGTVAACVIPVEDEVVATVGEATEATEAISEALIVSCNDGNPCTTDTLIQGIVGPICVRTTVSDGTVCGGSDTNEIYGRCEGGMCSWSNWHCVDGGLGTICNDGADICASDGVCCVGCTTATGACLTCFGVMHGQQCPASACY